MEFSLDSHICIINYLLRGRETARGRRTSDIWVVACQQICSVMQTLFVVILGYEGLEQEQYFSADVFIPQILRFSLFIATDLLGYVRFILLLFPSFLLYAFTVIHIFRNSH